MSFQNISRNIDDQIGKIPVPDINLGSHVYVDGYYVSKTLIWFKNLTRYNSNFQPTEVSLVDEINGQELPKPYLNSLAIYAAMAGIVAVGLTIFLIVFCCCNCMFRSAAPRHAKMKKAQRSSRSNCILGIIISAVAILGAATFVIGFIGETRIHDGADSACYTVNNVTVKMRSIKSNTESIQKNLDAIDLTEVKTKIDAIQSSVNSLPDSTQTQQFKDYVASILSLYDSVKVQVESAKKQISDQILNAKFLDEIIKYAEQVNTECPNVKKYLRLGCLIVLIVLAISSLLFIIGLCNNCFQSIFTLWGYIMFNVLIVFGIGAFIVLIGGSDFCMESKPIIHKLANEPMLDYYLYCPVNDTKFHHIPKHVIKREVAKAPTFDLSQIGLQLPLIDLVGNSSIGDLFGQAQDIINKANEYVGNMNHTIGLIDQAINDYCKQVLKLDDQTCDQLKQQVDAIKDVVITGSPQDPSLVAKMQTILENVNSIMVEVDCTEVTGLLNTMLTNVCTSVYEAFFFFLINSLAATLCFYALLLLSIWMLF